MRLFIIWGLFQIRVPVPFRVLFIRVPYYIGDLKGDPSLENYPYVEIRISSHPNPVINPEFS